MLMRVSSCITEELLIQDDMVLEATRMTKWNSKTKLANHTDMVKVNLTGKIYQGEWSFRMRPLVKESQQCINCQRLVHHARTCRSEIHPCRYCTGRHHFYQSNDNKQLTLKCANFGKEHSTTSRLCPKRLEAEKKAETAPTSQRSTQKQDGMKPAPIQLANTWVTLTVQEVEKRPFLCNPINSHNLQPSSKQWK